MKKTAIVLFCGFFGLCLVGCGEQYTPLNDEQIEENAMEQFEVKKEEMAKMFEEKCTSMMDSLVDAKIQELNQ